MDDIKNYKSLRSLEADVERLVREVGGASRIAGAGEGPAVPSRRGSSASDRFGADRKPIMRVASMPQARMGGAPVQELGAYLKQENARLRDDLAQMRSQSNQLNHKNTELETKIAELTLDLERQQEMVESLHEENSRLRRDVQRHARDKEEMDAQGLANLTLEERYRDLEGERHRLEEEIRQLRISEQGINKLRDDAQKMQEENELLREDVRQLRFEKKQKDRTINGLNEQIAQKEDHLQNSKQKGSRSDTFKEELITQLREENERYLGDLQGLQSRVKHLEQDRENALQDLDQCRARLDDATDENKELRNLRKLYNRDQDQRKEILSLRKELTYMKLLEHPQEQLKVILDEVSKLQLTYDIYRSIRFRDSDEAERLTQKLKSLSRPPVDSDGQKRGRPSDVVADVVAEANIMDEIEVAISRGDQHAMKELVKRAQDWGIDTRYVEQILQEMQAKEDVSRAIESKDPRQLRRVIHEAEYWNVDAKEGSMELQKMQVQKQLKRAREERNVELLKSSLEKAKELGVEAREDEDFYTKLKLQADMDYAINQRNFPFLLMSVTRAQQIREIDLTRPIRVLDQIAEQRNWRCVCGNVLNVCVAKDCYGGKEVVCAITKNKLKKNSLVWHCFRGKCEKHPNGWNADLVTAIGRHQSRVTGKVVDCETFTPIPEATVRLRASASRQARSIDCNKKGAFDLMTSPGDLSLLAEKQGYDPTAVQVMLGDKPHDLGLFMSKKCRPDQIRIVLTWSDIEKALSPVLWCKRFSVDAKKKRATSDRCTAELFSAAKRKFGPQTITISRISDSPASELHYLVRQQPDVRECMGDTLGRVTVYRHEHEPLTFDISRTADLPRNCGGHYWHVFTIKLVPLFQIRRVNEFYPSWPKHLG